jgi:hypothetical protein
MSRWIDGDFVGMRYGRLVVVEPAPSNAKSKNKQSLCRCDCGNTKVVTNSQLRNGKTKSCGCMKTESAMRAAKASIKHGMRGCPEYRLWQSMLNRCRNTNITRYVEHYSGRGIKVCEQWQRSFEVFFADMGPRPTTKHSLDRIDVNSDYTPENCRWATATEQQRNKRNTIMVTWNGETKCIRDWEDSLGDAKEILYNRLRNGWPVEKAFTTPSRKKVTA